MMKKDARFDFLRSLFFWSMKTQVKSRRRQFLKSFFFGLSATFSFRVAANARDLQNSKIRLTQQIEDHSDTVKSVRTSNPIVIENQKQGTTDWQLTNPATKQEIEGYASLTSINRGGKISLFVNTNDPTYTIEIFRMGWYDGTGGRRITDKIALSGIKQPPPVEDKDSGLIECDWKNPYILNIPYNSNDATDWASGVYLAKLTASKSGKQSYIIFVVRDDARNSDILFQQSVTTYQAYNNWGNKSLYRWNSRRIQAYQVSFNRPYSKSPNPAAAYGVGAGEFLTNFQPTSRTSTAGWEYNMVRWLEKSGYDVSYATNIDTHANHNLLLSHKAFLSVGHDEYWSWQMRENVETALKNKVSLGFFGANTCFWQIRLDLSPITKVPYRTIIAYKENAALDYYQDHRNTTLWRQSPVQRPEDALIGVMYDSDPVDDEIVIDNAPAWLLSNTSLTKGSVLPGLLGYEVDRMFGNAPANTIRVAHSPYRYKGRTRYADMTVYTASSGATVFATGSMQWVWSLDDYNAPKLRSSRLNLDAQQMTHNVLARLLKIV
ncbi:hypothetical protein Cri9333_3417 [Crinalium epipsammum PCC 9333]|uniref:N,N-dimethylformamidase beta subunit-like C-terminal domain-containing protein n=2 Tax=Crinalium TaxID=241421 RepID=K9W468_9CYAN|nr:hypothetical protein Cri9333_3417 [Crinalium epipsammum PCC 9333]